MLLCIVKIRYIGSKCYLKQINLALLHTSTSSGFFFFESRKSESQGDGDGEADGAGDDRAEDRADEGPCEAAV